MDCTNCPKLTTLRRQLEDVKLKLQMSELDRRYLVDELVALREIAERREVRV